MAAAKNSTRNNVSRLMLGSALSALAVGAAYAQGIAEERVVVTGTSIRGTAPTGLNLMSVNTADIEKLSAQNTLAIVQSVPAVSFFGRSTQGSAATPTIHNLGDTASTATLVLVDGHRIPKGSTTGTYVDSGVISGAAVQRVEVLPDGASAIYGADALAGVINIITKKNFDGWSTDLRHGEGDAINTTLFSTTFGKQWGEGGVVAVYSYTNASQLLNKDRDYVGARQDLLRGPLATTDFTGMPARPAGIPTEQPYPAVGNNFADFFCGPATIAAASGTTKSTTNVAFYAPYNGTGIPVNTNPIAGTCDRFNAAALLPSELKNQGFISIHQSITDAITLNADVNYSSRMVSQIISRGTVQAIAYGPTATPANAGNVDSTQINPFYVGNATTGTNSQFIRYDFNDMFGPGAFTKNGQTNLFADIGATVDLGGEWAFTTNANFGTDDAWTRAKGVVNAAAAFLALNGRPNQNGTNVTSAANSVVPDPNGLGTTETSTRILTAANALDVWNTGAANRTSQAVKDSLLDNRSNVETQQYQRDVTAKVDGPLFDNWAGTIRVAVGGEFTENAVNIRNTQGNTLAMASGNSNYKTVDLYRNSYSAYLEIAVPFVNAEMGIPLMRNLDFNIAGRFDRFSDVGDTSNPKVGFNWDVTDGLKLRGAYGTSFSAPSLASIGQPGTGLTSELLVNNGSAGSFAFANSVTVPYAYRGTAGTFLQNAATCSAAGGTPVTNFVYQGVAQGGCTINTTASGNNGITYTTGGNPSMKPQTGVSYSFGADFDLGALTGWLEGLTGAVTYYEAKMVGVITTQGRNYTSSLITPAFQSFINWAPPGGWTAASPFIQNFIKGIPLGAALPPTIWYAIDGRQTNLYNVWTNGIDFQFNYGWETSDYGNFNVNYGGNEVLRFSQAAIDPLGGTGALTDIKGGLNSGRYQAIEFKSHLALNWDFQAFSTQLSWDYLHPTHSTTQVFPYLYASADGTRNANDEKIAAVQTFDLNVTYKMPESWLPGGQLYLNVDNLLDTPPPWYNAAIGYIATNGDPTGRVIAVGIRTRF